MMKNLHELKLNDASYGNQSNKFRKKLKNFTFFSLTIMLMFFSLASSASHIRYLNLTWRPVSGRTVEFKFSYAQAGTASIGQQLNFGINTGAGSVTIPTRVTSNNTAENYFYAEGTALYTYPANGNYTASFSSCCRIFGMVNNSSGSVYVGTIVNVGTGNSSPIATLPPVVNVSRGVSATFTLPANDPDGDVLSYRLAIPSEMGGGTQPAGLSVNSSTGLVTFNTTNASINQLYSAVIIVGDGKTSISVDFIIKVTQQSIPPVFDYLVTPASGTVFQVSPGQAVNFNLRATDSDIGDNVSLSGVGIPLGAVTSPSLPRSGNPVQSSFSWTPSNSNLGTNVINFIAQDNQGVQTTTSVTIQVSLKPIFNSPPTPAGNSTTFVTAGNAINLTIQASDPDPNDRVQIVAATLPGGASLGSSLPTALGNPTSTSLSWTPAVSQWGLNSFNFTARDTYGDQTNHKFDYVVNTPPVITSVAPSTNLVAGQLFTYNIVAADSDLPFGDELEFTSTQLPSWLSLTDNGDGTATLTGTPTIADAGSFSLNILAENTYHHDGGVNQQTLNFVVVPCNTTLASVVTDVACPGYSNGAISLTVNGGTAPFTFAWSNGADTKDLSNLAAGNYSVTVTDANNCTESLIVTVQTTPDVTAPVVPVLADVNGQCSATVTVPSTTDNCAGVIVGTTTDALTYSSQGTYVVTWSFNDGNGNLSTATQNVIVKDVTSPVVPVLADVNGQCSATVTVPSTTDNCAGVIVGTTTDALSYSSQGTYVVTWSFNDGNGNLSTATQNVIVKDVTAPVVPVLADVNGQCSATVTVPSTTDNCAGVIVGTTTDALSYSSQGTYVVTWSFNDGNGNISTATQNVIVKDNTAPVVITQNLTIPLVNGTATITAAQINNGSSDNCGVASISIDKTSFNCSTIGNHTVTLTVTDVNGNVASQTANVTVVGELTSSSIASVPTNGTYTGGVSTNLYLGYGAQSTTLQVSNLVIGGNGVAPRSYTYTWSGSAASQLSSTTSGSPVFTPTDAGYYTFNVIVTNKYGCTSATTISICVKDIREVDKKGKFTGKVFICHAPPGNPSNSNTLSISVNAVAAHLSQHSDDRLGSCSDAPCAAPSNLTMSTNATNGSISAPTKVDATEFIMNKVEMVAYPNPFTQQTTVRFTLPYQEDNATLDIYDLKGVKIQTLFKGNANAQTTYEVQFNGQNLSAGTYFFRLSTAKEVKNFKVVMSTN
jgi:hypothetical protein